MSLLIAGAMTLGGLAQETFVYEGPAGPETWESPGHWSGGSGSFSTFPGENPAAGTLDSVDFSVDPPSGTLDLALSTPGLSVDQVRLGPSITLIRSTGEGTFTANEFESSTPGGSSTVGIFADFVMPSGTVEFRPGVTGYFVGSLINSAPANGSIRTVRNESQRRLTIEGDVVLSDDPDTYGHLRFRNGGLPADTVIEGEISDGAAAGGRVNFGRGTFYITGDQAYSGVTQIGENDPNVETIVEISSDGAFGTSRLDVSGGNALKTIRAAGGTGTRTLPNDIRIARAVQFAGSESFVLDGLLYQSNGRELINGLGVGRSLTINGNIYASNTTDVRDWIFEGIGLTIVNSTIDDSLGHPGVTGASLIKRDVGRVVLTHPDVAAYGGTTSVNGGVLQLGDGGAAVGLNGNPVSGSDVGTLEINHAAELTFDSAIGGELAVRHVGPGITTLTAESSGSGNFQVEAGTLIVDGTTGSGDVAVGQGAVVGGNGSIGGLLEVAGTVAPGTSAGELAAGSVVFQDGAQVAIEIGGTGDDGQYDRLLVESAAALDGVLTVDLIDQFVPAPTELFTILEADSLAGAFDNVANGGRIDTLGGAGSFLVSYDAVSGEVALSDFEAAVDPLAGDYNGNGIVDTADYTVWRDTLGQSGAALAADGSGPEGLPDGMVDHFDYQLWKANFGMSSGGAAVDSLATVPEPAGGMLAGLGGLALGWAAAWRRSLGGQGF